MVLLLSLLLHLSHYEDSYVPTWAGEAAVQGCRLDRQTRLMILSPKNQESTRYLVIVEAGAPDVSEISYKNGAISDIETNGGLGKRDIVRRYLRSRMTSLGKAADFRKALASLRAPVRHC